MGGEEEKEGLCVVPRLSVCPVNDKLSKRSRLEQRAPINSMTEQRRPYRHCSGPRREHFVGCVCACLCHDNKFKDQRL